MTFWPRFAVSRYDLGNLVKVEDMFTLRPAPSTKIRGGSCCGSQIGSWPNIFKVLSGCKRTHSKIPTNIHATALHSGLGTVDWGLGGGDVVRMGWWWGIVWGWSGDGHWGAGNVFYVPLNYEMWLHYFMWFYENNGSWQKQRPCQRWGNKVPTLVHV